MRADKRPEPPRYCKPGVDGTRGSRRRDPRHRRQSRQRRYVPVRLLPLVEAQPQHGRVRTDLKNAVFVRRDQPIDIGVLKLADAVVPPFPELNKFAMDISYLRPRLLPWIERLYAIVGFPASQSKVNPVTRQIAAPAYAYRDRSAPDDQYLAHGISPQTHIVLPLDLKDGVDPDGRHRNFPRPQGMSGSPIWMLLDEQDNVSARVYPVVAVGTKYRKSRRALIGTDIEVALRMIRNFG